MKVTSKGFDPTLGKRFAEESGGFVIARGPSSQKKSVEEMPPGLDAQQQHDWLRAHPGAKDPSLED